MLHSYKHPLCVGDMFLLRLLKSSKNSGTYRSITKVIGRAEVLAQDLSQEVDSSPESLTRHPKHNTAWKLKGTLNSGWLGVPWTSHFTWITSLIPAIEGHFLLQYHQKFTGTSSKQANRCK